MKIGAALLTGVVLLSFALRWPIADVPFERDEGEYAYIAQRWLLAEIPYRDAFDQKPPGVFALFALFISLFGPTPSAVHWGLQAYSVATFVVVFLLGGTLFSTTAGVAAAAFTAISISQLSFRGNSANTETFAILPMTAHLLIASHLRQRPSVVWAILGGAIAVAALLFKQVALAPLLVSFGFLLTPGGDRRGAAFMALSVALSLGAVATYFAAHGALSDFYDCVIGFNLHYATRVPLTDYPAAFAQSFGPILASCGVVFFLAAVAAVFPLLRRTVAQDESPPSTFLIALWLLACFVATSIGGRFFPHYFVLLIPALSLLAGQGATILSRLVRRPSLTAGFLVGLALLNAIVVAPWYYKPGLGSEKVRLIYPGDSGRLFAASRSLGAVVAERTHPTDRVFILGSEPQILFDARRRSASRYIFSYPLLIPAPGVRERQRAALAEVLTHRPVVIVEVFAVPSRLDGPATPPDLVAGIHRLLEDEYRVVALLPSEPDAELIVGPDAQRRWDHAPGWFKPAVLLAAWERRSP